MTLVHLDIEDGVALVRLDNPPLNLFTRQLTLDLREMLAGIAANDAIGAVVVTGTGARPFSAGSDIREFPPLMQRGTVVEEKLADENAAFSALATLPQPTIAAIAGVALGGGAEFSLCCDYRIMSEGATIGFPEIHLGTVPGSGGLTRLPRLVGASAALALMLDGRPIDARRALAIGLADEVVEAARCLQSAMARAREWASRPRLAARAIKAAVLQVSGEQVAADVAASLDVSRAIFATDDMREGVAAFMAKRPPRFTQR